MSATYAGVTPSLPFCNPNASRTDERPVQLTRTDGHVIRTDGNVDNPELITTLPAEPFMKWGFDFVGLIKKTRHTGKRYILVATDYATKWVEARALRTNSAHETAQFLYELVLTRFGCPLQLVSDQGSHFLNGTIQVLTEYFLLRHTTSTTYYPQGNGQVESTNKVIVKMLQKLVNDNRTDWDIQLYLVLFSYRTAYKVATGHSPFELVMVSYL